MKKTILELKTFLILWATQSLSQLGSAMTGFALTLWLYQKTGSALQTALLSICSYAPYVLLSIFAGTLSDRWDKKKTMLACDTFAACCTLGVLILLKTDALRPAHLYILNALTGLMNTVQQPASEVAMTLITPKEYYQKTSGLTSFSNSLVTILNPVLATAVFAFGGDGWGDSLRSAELPAGFRGAGAVHSDSPAEAEGSQRQQHPPGVPGGAPVPEGKWDDFESHSVPGRGEPGGLRL